MDAKLKDFELIEKAGFTHEIKFMAQAAVSSLYYLKSLSLKSGIPIEQITAEQIIKEFSGADAQIKEHQQKFSSFLKDNLARNL